MTQNCVSSGFVCLLPLLLLFFQKMRIKYGKKIGKNGNLYSSILEGERGELTGARHQLEPDYKEQLRREHAELAARYEKFSADDQDMLGKARRIKDQAIEMKTLEKLLHEKTKQMSDQLSEINL